ncbi:hypothetical protein H5410_017773 [Solanum commersonii]|uniref:Radical S-adenosyl methionine domain-containing protein 1, mitochondrial n=1 Tax=Solanum commersonii TaxID=4109 RepID=A0A9J6A043_SOLCO|nr:hypothetical protein H5410_017773 [Solanum commersonii]
MLRSTLTPILTAFPSKAKKPRNYSNTIITAITNPPQPVRQNASMENMLLQQHTPTSAYLHLPFCRKRCHYCDFPIVALGSSSPYGDDDPRIINYIDFLCREIKATSIPSEYKLPLETVFFGGGTPSLVPPRLVSLVMETLDAKFGVCSDAEVSIEMDPGTFDAEKLKDLMKLGVNRVSLGVQAFQEELLRSCGRAHGVQEIHEAIDIVGSCGVENWSVDLISSLPHQKPHMWEQSLSLTIQAKPTHVSVYDLQVEQDTKFASLMASEMLRDAGYEHYEISSYCKSGYQCKHNYTYWINKPFYAFGLGSASYLNGLRFSRPRKLKDYMGYVQNLENGLVNCSQDSKVDAQDIAMDVVMLSLRTARGLDLKSFGKAFGSSTILSLCEVYKPHIQSGHVVCLDEHRREISPEEFSSLLSEGNKINEVLACIRLSDPDGFLLSNELISSLNVLAP